MLQVCSYYFTINRLHQEVREFQYLMLQVCSYYVKLHKDGTKYSGFNT